MEYVALLDVEPPDVGIGGAQEFPRVDERLVGKRHRYGYAPSVDDGTDGGDTLPKHDLVGGNAAARCFDSGKALSSSSSSPHHRMPPKMTVC